MQKENQHGKNNKVILNRGLYLSVLVRGRVNYRIQNLQRWLLRFVNNVRGRCQIKFGMTPLFNKGGFTLIELLVVVLIIAILAAVALPQYQLAVAKSRIATTLPLLNKFHQDQELFYLANGGYASTWEELGTDTPTQTFSEDGRSFRFQKNLWILSSGGSHVWVQMFTLGGGIGTFELHTYGSHATGVYANKRVCVAFEKLGEKICESYGGEEFERGSWVKYWLP